MGKTVLTYGTFDMFHIGHLALLERASTLGDDLIVGISSDKFNEEKGKKCLIPYEQRARIVSSIKGVTSVFKEEAWDQKRDDILKYNVDLFVMGDDWRGKFDQLNQYCEVKYLERTDGISTTKLKGSFKNFTSIPKEQIIEALEVLEILKKDFQ